MKKMFNIGGEGVDTVPPVRTAFDHLFTIDEEFQKLMELSAYVAEDKDGRNVRQMFPKSGKSETVNILREKFKEAKRKYVYLRDLGMEERSDLKADYYSPIVVGRPLKTPLKYAEKHCWPGSSFDKQVQTICREMGLEILMFNINFSILIPMFNIVLVSPHLFSDQGVRYHLVGLRGTNVINVGAFLF